MLLGTINATAKQKRLRIVAAFSFITILSCGSSGNLHQNIEVLENSKTYTIWETLHTFYDEGETDELLPNNELIKSLPQSVKTIIAHYSTLIPDYMWTDSSSTAFAAALGDYPTLFQAQAKLLKGQNIKTAFKKGVPVLLEVKETGDAIFFTCYRGWQNSVTDEFRISKNGTIVYVEASKSP